MQRRGTGRWDCASVPKERYIRTHAPLVIIHVASADSFCVNTGIHVFATARNLSSLVHFKDLANITCLRLDVTSPESIAAAVQQVKSSDKGSGRLKYLVNNAGVGLVGPLLDGKGVSAEERAVFETNLWGPLAVIRAFVPIMVESSGGTLVNIGSSAGVINVPWNGILCFLPSPAPSPPPSFFEQFDVDG